MLSIGRCPWCGNDPLYVAYHDAEWGVPERDPRKLWELLILESFQAGLSWITILRKREAFRARFEGFEPRRVARWGAAEIEAALGDPGIVRHRGKIEAAVRGAQAWERIEAGQGFSAFIWDRVGGVPVQNDFAAMGDVPAETPLAKALSKALKAEGFNFVGPKICYAFLQAAGLVNDHLTGCPRHAEVAALGARAEG